MLHSWYLLSWRRLSSAYEKCVLPCQGPVFQQHVSMFSIKTVLGHKQKGTMGSQRDENFDAINMQEAEELQDWIETRVSNKETNQDDIRVEQEHQRKLLVRRIIKQKYFRPPQETNLLTWAAKQQIRFLNTEYPEEWTPERLADSFPISVEGVKKLLQSRYVHRSQDEINRHDQRVAMRWKTLHDSNNSGKAKNQMLLPKHADGNRTLPQPSFKLPDHHFGRKTAVLRTGLFTSLLPLKLAVAEATDDSSKLTENPSLPTAMSHVPGQKQIQTSQNEAQKKRWSKITSMEKITASYETSHVNLNSCDEHHSPPQRPSKSLRRLRSMEASKPEVGLDTSSACNEHDKGMIGTVKLHSSPNQESCHTFSQHNIDQMSAENEQLASATRLKVNIDSYNSGDNRVVDLYHDNDSCFIYNNKTGYQYPFGRTRDLPVEKINVTKNKAIMQKLKNARAEASGFRVGNDFYDEHGNFLYRMP